MIDVKKLTEDFCRENHLDINFSENMPEGYETANGTFDITNKTLFFNTAMLEKSPDYEVLFYLFHELRHVMQYIYPELFSPIIRLSLNYVLMYDGTCYKLINGEWAECKLEGTEAYLSCAYLGQPYELDANRYAYEQVGKLIGPSQELDGLYSFWIPQDIFPDAEYMRIYRKIDAEIGSQTH